MKIEILNKGNVSFLKVNDSIIRRGENGRMKEHERRLLNGSIKLNNDGRINIEDIIYNN